MLDDIYQLTVRATLFGKNINNIFFYQKQGTEGTAADVRAAFFDTMTIAIRNIQSQAVQWVAIDTINLGDPGDFEKYPFSVTGLAGAGDTLPAHDAVGYTLNLATRAIRPGSKRFAGILESAVLNGVLTDPAYVGHVEDLRVKLDDPLVGAVGSYDPIVVKRVKEPVVGTVPPQFNYRLPKDAEVPSVGLIVSAYANPEVTTQVSRKS